MGNYANFFMIGRLPRNLDRPLLGTCENAKAHLAPPGGFTVTVPFTLFFVPCWANFFLSLSPLHSPKFRRFTFLRWTFRFADQPHHFLGPPPFRMARRAAKSPFPLSCPLRYFALLPQNRLLQSATARPFCAFPCWNQRKDHIRAKANRNA